MQCLRLQTRQLERQFRVWDPRQILDQYSIRAMHSRFRKTEREYWETIITRQDQVSRKLWSTINSVLGRSIGQRHSCSTIHGYEAHEVLYSQD